MKVRASVKKICDKCKVIHRRGVVRVICERSRSISSVRDKFALIFAEISTGRSIQAQGRVSQTGSFSQGLR